MPSLSQLLPTLVKEPLPQHLVNALRHEGLHEIPGVKNNPELMKILDWADGRQDGRTLGAQDDDEAYCSKGHCAEYEIVGIRSTRNPMARSWLNWKDGVTLNGPAMGCTVILSRPPSPTLGHVFWSIGRTAAGMIVGYGYNQKDSVCASVFDPQRIIGYRWAKALPLPKAIGFLKLPLLTLADGRVSSNEA